MANEASVAPVTPQETTAGSGLDSAAPAGRRTIRSFVVRAGRMGTGQIRALEELAPLYTVPLARERHAQQLLDWRSVFGNGAPVVLEIGFGMGQATAAIAASRPDLNFLGIEVHPPGVGALLLLIQEHGLRNVRIIQDDAVEVLAHGIAPSSLHGVHIFFPDPWHKKRHNKRRLIQPGFVRDLVRHIAPGGYLHCATDWQPYAEQMLAVLSAEPALENTVPLDGATAGYAPRPAYRPLTKFEARGIRLGHGVWDLVFRRR